MGIVDINLPRLETYLNQGLDLDQGLEPELLRLVDNWRSLLQQSATRFKLHGFATVSSTNDMLWQLLDSEWEEGTVAIARQQEAGRGQWGRTWQSALGGLYLSLALTPNILAIDSGQLTLCTCWGMAIALRAYKIPVWIKWPNDLVVQGRKLGGILLETRLQKGKIHRALVGVGINWANPVPDSGINLQSLLAAQLTPTINSLEQLAAIALHGIMAGYRFWQQQGIESLLPFYQTLLTHLGQFVTVNDCLGQVSGVSADGHLIVQVPSTAGSSLTKDIFLLPGAISLGYGNSGTEWSH